MIDDESDEQLIWSALNMWANWIETGDVVLSDADLERQGRPPRRLTEDQRERVKRLRELAASELRRRR